MVSRAVPQLNVFSVGCPLKVGVAMLVVAASLPFLGGWMSDQVQVSVSSALPKPPRGLSDVRRAHREADSQAP